MNEFWWSKIYLALVNSGISLQTWHVVQAGLFIGCWWSWNSWNWDLPKPGHPPWPEPPTDGGSAVGVWFWGQFWDFPTGQAFHPGWSLLSYIHPGLNPNRWRFNNKCWWSWDDNRIWFSGQFLVFPTGQAFHPGWPLLNYIHPSLNPNSWTFSNVGEAGTTIDSGSLVSSGIAPTSGAVEDSGTNKFGISSNSIVVGSAGGVGGVGTTWCYTCCWGTGKLKPLCSGVETGSSTAGDRWAGTSGLRGQNSSQICPAATSTISLGSTEAMVSILSRATLCQERLDRVIAGGVGDNDSGNSRFIRITF